MTARLCDPARQLWRGLARRLRSPFSLLLLLTALPVIAATAERGQSGVEALGPPIAGRFDSLTDQIYPTSTHHLSDRLSFPEYYQWKRRLSAKHGIDFVLINSPIVQAGSADGEVYLDNELDLYLQWRPFESAQTSGKLFFWGQWVQTFSDLPTGAFAAAQGVFSQPNGGATDPDKTVVAPSALWWEQTFHEPGLTYRLGQLYASSLWGSNQYLGDDRATFMNSLPGSNQGLPWASGNRGIGAMFTLAGEHVYASVGFQDAKADQQKIDFSSFAEGDYAYLAELGLTPTLPGRHDGAYKLTLGYVDATGDGQGQVQSDGWGLSVSARQDIGEEVGLFAVYRRSWDRYASNTKAAAAAGAMWKRPFGWADDRLGVSAFYASPENDNGGELTDEYGIEAFWRLQVTPRLDVTPDVQVYLQPGRKAQRSPVGIFGLRLRYIL